MLSRLSRNEMTENYYLSQKPQLLQGFDKAVDRAREVFVARYGEQLTNELVRETRKEYEALIPKLPYIGGKQPFTQFIISTAWFLAMYRILKRQGETVEQVGTLAYDASRAFLKAYPRFLSRFFGHMTFSRIYLQRLQRRASESQERRYPSDYVYHFVKGDGKTFDYGVDYIECATIKFLKGQGSPELAPYLCAADHLYSEALGWGLMRTMTLAEGAEKCDFRFKKGGETRVALPGPLEQHLRSKPM